MKKYIYAFLIISVFMLIPKNIFAYELSNNYVVPRQSVIDNIIANRGNTYTNYYIDYGYNSIYGSNYRITLYEWNSPVELVANYQYFNTSGNYSFSSWFKNVSSSNQVKTTNFNNDGSIYNAFLSSDFNNTNPFYFGYAKSNNNINFTYGYELFNESALYVSYLWKTNVDIKFTNDYEVKQWYMSFPSTLTLNGITYNLNDVVFSSAPTVAPVELRNDYSYINHQTEFNGLQYVRLIEELNTSNTAYEVNTEVYSLRYDDPQVDLIKVERKACSYEMRDSCQLVGWTDVTSDYTYNSLLGAWVGIRYVESTDYYTEYRYEFSNTIDNYFDILFYDNKKASGWGTSYYWNTDYIYSCVPAGNYGLINSTTNSAITLVFPDNEYSTYLPISVWHNDGYIMLTDYTSTATNSLNDRMTVNVSPFDNTLFTLFIKAESDEVCLYRNKGTTFTTKNIQSSSGVPFTLDTDFDGFDLNFDIDFTLMKQMLNNTISSFPQEFLFISLAMFTLTLGWAVFNLKI